MTLDPGWLRLMKTLGNRIRWARERADMTQSELATQVNVAAGSRVSEWENDRRQPSAPVLMALPGVLGISGHWLLTGGGARLQNQKSATADMLMRAIQRIVTGEIPSEVVRMLANPSASAYLTGARSVESPPIPEPAVPSAILRRRWLAARIEHHEAPYYLDLESPARADPAPPAPPEQPAATVEDPSRPSAEPTDPHSIYEGGYVWGHLAH